MVRQLLGNAAGPFSVNKFHGDLKSQGIPVAKDTLHCYLGYLEDAFLIRIVSMATDSERRRMVNPRKVYPIDSGLIPLFDRTGKSNVGHSLETCVKLELDRRGIEVGYVHTAGGYEVDFLARYPEGKEALIQVCASLDDPVTRVRETRALLEASSQYPRASLHIISLDIPSALDMPGEIIVHAASDWLLREKQAA